MDRAMWNARTDNIVVVDASTRSLTWIPRDLWSPLLSDRINIAFSKGGHEKLLAALRDHEVDVDESICLLRDAVDDALRDVSVTVPVEQPLRFWYPMTPESEIEDGRKEVAFDPPSEELSGERIHQWIGARYDVAHADGSDTSRFPRQQVLIRCLIEDGFDFSRVLDDETKVSLTGDAALTEVRQVRADWHYTALDDVWPAKVEGKSVLVRRPRQVPIAPRPVPPFWRRKLAALTAAARRRS
jgi:anionic cell wall polymer biosynthesis LytR-Cps2A-Psr (LCP) family protein